MTKTLINCEPDLNRFMINIIDYTIGVISFVSYKDVVTNLIIVVQKYICFKNIVTIVYSSPLPS